VTCVLSVWVKINWIENNIVIHCCTPSKDYVNLNRLLTLHLLLTLGYRGGSPTAVRPSDPALCGSCPL